MYPEAYEADTAAAKEKLNILGSFSYANISETASHKHGTNIVRIYNLYGQTLCGRGARQVNYEALYSALEGAANSLRTIKRENNLAPIVGLPYRIGSDRAGGSWEIVSRLIEVAFDGYEADVLILKLDPPKN
jgi:hypothetical protein